ncbi:MAG: hypothetical protein NC311_18465, partial [Muribaculaceae bacterium]|nr:hypothetical protein [Muribaculaceae bacterium]
EPPILQNYLKSRQGSFLVPFLPVKISLSPSKYYHFVTTPPRLRFVARILNALICVSSYLMLF